MRRSRCAGRARRLYDHGAVTVPRPPRIGELCFGGDWACAHGDLAGLADILQQLASYAREPLHCELAALAEACHSDPDHAAARWFDLKEQLQRGDFARRTTAP
jgi:hypothetical protein